MNIPRRSVGLMPYHRRCDGFCALERREEYESYRAILTILGWVVGLGLNLAQMAGLLVGVQNVFQVRIGILRTSRWHCLTFFFGFADDPSNTNHALETQ